MNSFTYDIAFSFLETDLGFVRQIEDRLEGRFKTFNYVDHQPKVVGTDGHETLARIFEIEARTSVVVFRRGWGDRGFTVSEKTGVQNRGNREGWESLLVVVLDNGSDLPRFIPKTSISYDLQRFGLDRLPAVLDAHVKRNGGEASEATVEGSMRAALRAEELEVARRRYLVARTGDGKYLWEAEGRRLQDLLIIEARSITALPLRVSDAGGVVSVDAPRASLTTTWRPDEPIWVMWCGFRKLISKPPFVTETRTVGEVKCCPDLDSDQRPAWKVDDRLLRSEDLVTMLLRRLAEHMKP